MKPAYLIPIVAIIGVVVLFFFPEPETNFLSYLGVALFFIIVIVLLLVWHGKKMKIAIKRRKMYYIKK